MATLWPLVSRSSMRLFSSGTMPFLWHTTLALPYFSFLRSIFHACLTSCKYYNFGVVPQFNITSIWLYTRSTLIHWHLAVRYISDNFGDCSQPLHNFRVSSHKPYQLLESLRTMVPTTRHYASCFSTISFNIFRMFSKPSLDSHLNSSSALSRLPVAFKTWSISSFRRNLSQKPPCVWSMCERFSI